MSGATIVTLGEVLATISGTSPGNLEVGASARLSFAGAECTVAIAAARLKANSVFIGRLGNDDLGRMIARRLSGEGVDTTHIIIDDTAPTALLLKYPRTTDVTRVSYYRRGCAGSNLSADDVPEEVVAAADAVHITGITPALGLGPASAIAKAIDIARSHSVLVSFDVNYRESLWPSKAKAAEVLGAVARDADVIFASPDELGLLVDGSPEAGIRLLLGQGAREIIIKDGERGARRVTPDETVAIDALSVTSVDPVGAGDCFVGGYLTGMLEGLRPQDVMERAGTLGAIAVSTVGDWEGLPFAAELETLRRSADVVR
jgi:2-dehydro-3-deoxygluconokinase